MDGVRKTSLLSGWSLVRSSSKYTRDAFGNASSRDDTSTISSDDDQYDEGDEQVDDLRSVLKQEGMPVASRQHLARELGLMDALMDLTVEFFRGGRHLPSTVHAVAMHALMLCYAECRENEVYAVKYSSGKWFHSLISQLEYAESGAASALTLLVCDNERLLARHIDDKIVDQFVAHINHQGPVSDLLHFLRAVCTCKGVGMRSNQELCLRKLGLASDNELVRNTLLLRICHNNDGSKVSMQKYLRTSSRRVSRRLSRTKSSLDSLRSLVSLGSTKLGHEYLLDEAQSSQTAPCDGKVRALLDFAYDSLPSNFLGHDLFPRFHPCLVTWTWPPHGDGWIQGMDSHLFWSPIDIGVRMERDEHLVVGLPTIRQDAHEWVDLSQLLWVLDRERLALKVLGASPDVVQGAIDSDPKLKIAFERHEQLADYLVAQIETAAELAADRSYNAIHRLEQEYPFSMLSSSMANEMLPLRARAGFAKLMMSLFVDRYPHTKLCSEAKLSHSVHVMTTESTNISRAFHLSDPDQTIADYNGRTPENEAFISFASSDKFFILEAEILHWFQQTQGVLVADDESSNAYTCALLDILSALISFGFCVNVKHQMHKALVMTLDGRSDIHRRKKLMMECRRGVKESRSIHVTKLKALEVLNACHDTTERERLLRFIDLFKAYNVEESFELQQSNLPNDKKDFGQKDDRQLSTTYQQTLLTRFCSQLCRKKSATASIIPEQASAVDRFRTKVEALFFEKEIKSSAECEGDTPPLDWILIDLILCDSDEITAMAFLLLQRFHFGRTRLLRQACSSLLLDAEELNVNGNCCFRTYDDLKSVVQQLRHHVRSYQIWAVSNDFSTAVDHTFRRVNQILADIHNFASIGDENFRLLMSLDVAEVLILVTRFETSLGTTKDAAKMRELVNKVYECFQVFLDLEGKTTGNREGLNKFVGKSVDNSKILLLVQPLGEKLKQEIAFIRKVSDCKWQDFEALDEVETSANLRLLTKYFQVESNRVQATLSIVSLLAAVLRRDHSLIVADSCMFDHLLHMLLADSGFAACLRSRLDLIDIFFVMVDEIDEASVANFVVRQQRCIFLMQVLLKYSAAIETELELSNCIRSDGDESSRILYHVQLVRLLETLTCAATSEQVSKIFPIETLLKNARLAIVGEIQSGLPCQAYISFLAGKLAVHQGEATDTVEVYCQAVEALADFIVRIPEENIRYNDGLVPATMGLIQTLIDTHAIPGSGVERRMLAKQSLIAKQDVANHLMPNCFRQTRFTGQDLPHACASPTSKRRSKHDEQPAHHKRIEFRKQCNVTLKNVMHPPMLERRSNAHIVAVNEKDSTRINFIRALSAIESSCDSDAAKFMETVMNCPYVAFKKVAARLMSFCQRNAGREEHEQTVFDMIKVLTDSLGREPPDNAHSRKLKSKRGTSNNLDEESARRELAKEIFDMIDLDGSGFLDQKEIISAIKLDKTVINYIHACEDRHLQGFCSPKMLLERLSSVDVDQNQKISAEEWIAAAVTPGITLTRRKQSALKLWHRMESRATDIFVVTLSIISVAISIARNASNTQNPTLQVCDFIITCLFTTEVATRMMLWMGLGRSIADYLNDFYRCVDFFVVLVDWLNILLGSTRNRTMITKGLRSVRFVKFIRRFVSLTRSTRIYTHARRVRANPQLLAVRATVAKNKLNHRQNLLAEQGAVSLVFELVATPSTNRRIREQSIKLGSRLLATGFRDNQARLYSIITRKDPDGMFFETSTFNQCPFQGFNLIIFP